MIYGRAVVGGYGKFMKLNQEFKQYFILQHVNAFVCGSQQAAKRIQKIGGGALYLYLQLKFSYI